MTTLEQKELRGITWKQAFTYLISVIGIVATVVITYQRIMSKLDKIDDKDQLRVVQIQTNKLQIEKLSADMRNLELRITILETKINDKK